MALQRQLISIALRGGIDSRSDRKAVVPGKLLRLENGRFASPGAIRKRAGYRALAAGIAGDAPIDIQSARALLTFRDELLVADGDRLYSYSESADEWVSKGAYVPLRVAQRPVVRDVHGQSRADGARHDRTGVELYAWNDTRGGIWFELLDSESGQVLRPPEQLSATGSRPRVVCSGDVFAIVYLDGARLWVRTLPATAPLASPTAAFQVTTDAGEYALDVTAPRFDAAANEEGLFVCYRSPAGICARTFRSANAVHLVGEDLLAGAVAPALTAAPDPFGGWELLHVDTSGWMVSSNWPDAGLTVRFSVMLAVLDDPETVAHAAIATGFQTGHARFFARASSNGEAVCWHVAGSPLVETVFRDVRLAGRPWVRNDYAYLPLVTTTSLQPTYFLARVELREGGERSLVAKWSPGLAGAAPAAHEALPGVFARGSAWCIPTLVRDRTEVDGGVISAREGLVVTEVDFDVPVSRAELGQSLHLSGGFVHAYDGHSIVEAGFHSWPEIDSVDPEQAGNLSEGTYRWVAVYAWTDANGLTHRSAPSIPVSLEASAGSGSTVRVWVDRLTSKAAVAVELYRTIADGTILYFAGRTTEFEEVGDATLNRIAAVFSEGPSDTALEGNAQLYTQPLQLDAPTRLENIAPGPVSALTVHRGRLWAVDSTDPLRVWFSQETGAADPVEFNDSLYISVDPRGGPVTALASLDTALALFKAASIYGLAGQGPDATGEGSDFGTPQLITTDCGCVAERSVATVPAGLVFQSGRGIHLLDRSMATAYVGADVEGLTRGARVTAAALMPAAPEVRLTLDSGIALVFDYLAGQWASDTGIAAVDAVVRGDVLAYARADGRVLVETPGLFTDDGAPIRLRIATSWLQLAGIGGFQRVRRLLVLGEHRSRHRLRIAAGYDFEYSPSDEQEIEPTPPAAYGEIYAFDQGQVYGGSYGLYAWRAHLRRQKCTALQITIEDVPTEDEHGEALSLSAIALEVGVKPGSYRRSAGATAVAEGG